MEQSNLLGRFVSYEENGMLYLEPYSQFLLYLRMALIIWNVTINLPGKALQVRTLKLIGPTRKLRRKYCCKYDYCGLYYKSIMIIA